jgi:cytochrome c553
MKPIAEGLDVGQRAAVSRFYADKPVRLEAAVREVERAHDADLLQLGAAIWSRGSAEHRVQACLTCHFNRRDAASAPIYPALAGQPERYIAEQLRQFRDGRRRNDIAGTMRAVAARLGDREIEALAAYIASLPP